MKLKNRKGFTLIELLVVIAIIAVLAVVVILSLNPAELLRQARDSNRVSDLATMKSALSLYLADVASPNLASSTGSSCAGYACIYVSVPWSSTVTSTAISGISTLTITSTTGSAARTIDSSGWIPVNLSAISSGAPIGNLPVDPVNSSSSFTTPSGGSAEPLVYMYVATTTNLGFKLTARTESAKYSNTGSGDVESTDGGNSIFVLEGGTNLKL